MKRRLFPAEQHTFDFYILLFFLLSFLGWIWEIGIYLIRDQIFVNRGFYRGPYLPIYGIGSILLYLALHHFHQKPTVVFFLSMTICSMIEYFTSWFLENKWGIRWWDYTGYFLNINGRICFWSEIGFGTSGTLLICYLIPFYMRLYHKIPAKWRTMISIILVTLFLIDATYSSMHPNTGTNITY